MDRIVIERLIRIMKAASEVDDTLPALVILRGGSYNKSFSKTRFASFPDLGYPWVSSPEGREFWQKHSRAVEAKLTQWD